MPCRIGITCGWEEAKNWHKLHDEYINAIVNAGGVPFLLPSHESPDLVVEYYNLLDGFLFSGGSDVDPRYFGEEPQAGLGEITPGRDTFELALAKLVLAGDKPALGICRGIQLLNIAAGGDIYQDIKGVTGLMHDQKAPRWYPTHTVQVLEESSLFQLAQKESFEVNSFHHQSVRRLGRGFKAVAWSKDGLIEAIESVPIGLEDAQRFKAVKGIKPNRYVKTDESSKALCGDNRIMGVQWHPECNWFKDSISFSLFKNLVEYALMIGENCGSK
jgi:putative glutamine amidotransferase